jgi:hypothetical protein
MCTPGVPTPSGSEEEGPVVQVKGVFGAKFDEMVKEETCKWTSSQQKYAHARSACSRPLPADQLC